MPLFFAGLFSVVVVATQNLPAEPSQPKVRGDVLAAVEKELQRLDKQAVREPGPDWPRPSREIAFLLLAGLAERANWIFEPSADERRDFLLDRDRSKTLLYTLAADARLVKIETWMQDKSGSYRVLAWELYRRQGEKWINSGRGETAVSD